jgi:Spy/CpxP family protein refolding chaperone
MKTLLLDNSVESMKKPSTKIRARICGTFPFHLKPCLDIPCLMNRSNSFPAKMVSRKMTTSFNQLPASSAMFLLWHICCIFKGTTKGCDMKKLSILTVAILFFSAALAFAQPWGRGMGPGFGRPFIDPGLNLSQEQEDKLQKLRESYLSEITPLQNRLFTIRAEIRLLWEEMNPDRDKIMQRQNEAIEIQKRLDEKAIMHRLDSQAVLTPEQRARMIGFGPGGRRNRGPGGKMGEW